MINEKIMKIINAAYNNVPYYNHLFNKNNIDSLSFDSYDDFTKIPISTKENIKEYGLGNFLDCHFVDEDGNLKKSSHITIQQTSGTTGEPLSIPWIIQEYQASVMNHWKIRYNIAKILPTDRMCSVWYTNNNTIPYCLFKNQFSINRKRLTYNTGLKYLKASLDFNPEWIYMPASMLTFLITIAQAENIPFYKGIKYIELATEPVTPYYRNIIETYFNQKAYDMYGCQETNGIAHECKNGHMHLLTNNIFLEIIDSNHNVCSNNEWGNVCVTGLHNSLFPIIRYQLNDIARINTDLSCKYSNNPILEIKSPRLPETLILDQELSPHGKLLYPLKRFNKDLQENDIIYKLQLEKDGTYIVSFINTDISLLDTLSSKFKLILYDYGIMNTNLKFSISDDCKKFYKVGVMRI